MSDSDERPPPKFVSLKELAAKETPPPTIDPDDLSSLKFLGLDIPAADLATTLRVIRAFKECESTREWAMIPFAAWAKLEQLEDFLRLRTGDGAEEVTDKIALKRWAEIQGTKP